MAIQEPPADPVGSAPTGAAPEPLPPIADGVERSLDPRWIRVERITGWIVTAPILAGPLGVLVLAVFLAPLSGWIKGALGLVWAVLALGLAWRAHRWPEVAHRHASYKVDARGIEIRRGVVWRKVINVPRSRVQHTDVSQGPLERGHDLATLVLYTAGTEHARVDLRGIDHATALRLRDHLVVGEGDDAV
jgi:membrane protein YdbS with pleckstrin-like domain